MKQIPIIMAATLWASSAWASCAMVEPVITPSIRVDPLDAAGPAELVQHFTLTFRRAGADKAPVLIRYQIVDEDSSIVARIGRSMGPQVEFQSSDSSRPIGAFRSEAYPLLRSGQVSIAPEAPAAISHVALRLTSLRDDLPAGIYREQFTVRYWCGDEDGMPYEAQGAVATSVVVPNVLSANIAGATARGEIDFLDFAQLERSLQISVRSTGPFKVTASSLNSGYLKRENTSGDTEADRIRYVARLDGRTLDIHGASTPPMERAGLAGRQIPLEVKVEDVSRKRAGLYADTLLLTLSPIN